MTVLLYILATIGGFVVGMVALSLLAWAFIHAVARAQIARNKRLAALTPAQTP